MRLPVHNLYNKLAEVPELLHAGASKLSAIFNNMSEATLPNGMHVDIAPARNIVSCQLLIRCGSNDDPPGGKGLAHLLEHMMFEQNDALDRRIRSFRARGGQISAVTSESTTCYIFSRPWTGQATAAEMFDLAADMVFRAQLNDRALAAEKKIIGAELAVRRGKSRMNILYRLHHAAYGLNDDETKTLGSSASLADISLDDLQHFYDTRYMPANARIQVTAPARYTVTRLMLARSFGTIESARPPFPVDPYVRHLAGYVGGYKRAAAADSEETAIGIGFLTPPAAAPGQWAVMDVLLDYLNQAVDAEIRYGKDRYGYRASAGIMNGFLYFDVGSAPADAARLQPAIIGMLRNIAEDKIDPGRLWQAVQNCRYEMKKNTGERLKGGKALDGLDDFSTPYDIRRDEGKQLAALDAVKSSDLVNLMRQILDGPPPTMVVLGDDKDLMSYDNFTASLKPPASAMPVPGAAGPGV